jgi:DNA repair exonuclease SbcCD ATPase subunit
MIGETLTRENLERIRDAMQRIQSIDRSQYFDNYLAEVEQRISELPNQADRIRQLEYITFDLEQRISELEEQIKGL